MQAASDADADADAPQGPSASASPAHASVPGPRQPQHGQRRDRDREPEKSASPSRAKPRSCTVCRARKVRCDKQMPCSNCKKAQIPCVLPQPERPRWARRLQQNSALAAAQTAVPTAAANVNANVNANPPETETANQLLGRLRNLEGLVRDLTGQLDQARAQAQSSSNDGASPNLNSPGSSSNNDQPDHHPAARGVESQMGKLALNPSSANRFWTRINEELRGLEMETRGLAEMDVSDSSDDEALLEDSPNSTAEMTRLPMDRNSLLFRPHASRSSESCYPLPSQVPFLLEIFYENVNTVYGAVHAPTINKMLRRPRTDNGNLTPANEALMFAMYYSGVTSMEDSDVVRTFACTKSELNLKFRIGFEMALAKADFLYHPTFTVVQALTIFVALARRHDSPKYVWMMTGLLIRMAQFLGLQREPQGNVTVYEREMRRRVWYAICSLDVRSSEDQGTELTITHFDTQLPTNINDSDIDPSSTEPPVPHVGITDMTFCIVQFKISSIARKIVTPGLSLEQIDGYLKKMVDTLEEDFLRFSPETRAAPGTTGFWSSFLMIIVTKLVVSKMTLLAHLPILFTAPSQNSFSEAMRNRLFIAALETAEYNHALNAEKSLANWRWVYETYSQWHAVIFICLEATRRPWSATVERAWTALQSPYLIFIQANANRNPQMWHLFRKLLVKVRRYRDAELQRLSSQPLQVKAAELEDRKLPMPQSPSPLVAESSAKLFHERWYELVGMSGSATLVPASLSMETPTTVPLGLIGNEYTHPPAREPIPQLDVPYPPNQEFSATGVAMFAGATDATTADQTGGQFFHPTSGYQDPAAAGPAAAWLWTEGDAANMFMNDGMNLDMDGTDLDQLDWNSFIQSMGQSSWNEQ